MTFAERQSYKKLTPGLVCKNIFMQTKNWKQETHDPKRLIGFSILNQHKQALQAYAKFSQGYQLSFAYSPTLPFMSNLQFKSCSCVLLKTLSCQLLDNRLQIAFVNALCTKNIGHHLISKQGPKSKRKTKSRLNKFVLYRFAVLSYNV